MRVLITLLVLLVAVPAFAQIPIPRATLYGSDPSLEGFSLALIPTPMATLYGSDPALRGFSLEPTVVQEPVPLEEESKPSLWWRLAGYGVYAACGTQAVAQQYRKDRTFGGYNPTVGNDVSRAFMTTALTEGSNIGSETLREKGGKVSKLALITRLGTLAGCTYAAAYNFNRGWKRR